jgi:hypothetical protein
MPDRSAGIAGRPPHADRSASIAPAAGPRMPDRSGGIAPAGTPKHA